MTIRLVRSALILALFGLAACGGPDSADETDFVAEESFETAYEDGKEDAARSGRFEVFSGSDGKYYFNLFAKNGQKVLRSQGYSSERSAFDGIASVKANIAVAARTQLLQAADGQWYFVVTASNGNTVGLSELYATRSGAEQALEAVRTTAKSATGVNATAAGPRYQVFKGLDGKYYFHLRSRNGAILLQSQAYTRRASAVSGTDSVTTNGATSARYEIRDTTSGQAYFVLRAANGQVIARGEIASSRTAAGRARDVVRDLVSSGTIAAP